MFDSFTDHLQKALGGLHSDTKLTPDNIEDTIREVRKSFQKLMSALRW